MKKEILFLIIGLIVGLGIGFVATSSQVSSETAMDSTMEASGMNMETHTHPMLKVDQSLPIPTVEIEALPDAKDGYNVHIITTNYAFTPEKVNEAPVANQGHAHIYVNDVKLARVYSDWFHVGADTLSEGANYIEVTLNANDHSEWMHDENHISASTVVQK